MKKTLNMNRISKGSKLSSEPGLDLTNENKRNLSFSSTNSFMTNTDGRIKKKARRKIRCTQEFNQLDRRSVFLAEGGGSIKKFTTKKQKNLDFLPRICLVTDSPAEKENFLPNNKMDITRDDRKARKISGSDDTLKTDLSCINVPSIKQRISGKSSEKLDTTPEEKRDSEVEFKKRKKKSKKKKAVKSRSPLEATDNQRVPKKERVSLIVPNNKDIGSSYNQRIYCIAERSSSSNHSLLKTNRQGKLAQSKSPADAVKWSISSGEVFIEETTDKKFELVPNPTDNNKTVGLHQERKSVRFRSTFEVQNMTSDISGLKSITFEDSCKEGSFKGYRKSPHVKKLSKSWNNNNTTLQMSPDKADGNRGKFAVVSPSLRENVTNTSFSQTPNGKQHKRSTFEMPSPILAPKQLRRCSSSGPISGKEDVSVVDLLSPTPRQCNGNETATASKLLRESTFTLEDRDKEQKKHSHYGKKLLSSDITGDIVSESIKFTSNGRRKWNKSLGVSFLDSSGNILNISPPFGKEPLDLSVSRETPKGVTKALPKKSASPPKLPKSRPSTTSTPIPANKKHSLRFELLKENCTSQLTETKATTAKKKSKMPNFALIHQRAYDKLENLKEMSERKAARAKLLLSGLKPVPEVGVKKSPSKSKKLLRYSPKTILPIAKVVRSSPNVMLNVKNNPKFIPVLKKANNLAPSLSNPKAVSRPVEKKVVSRPIEKKVEASHIPKLARPEKQKLTKLGFKVGTEAGKKTTKEEQVKAVANKSKVQTNTVDTRRNVIQNVRSNRRFELLMKMRNK